MVCHSIMSLSSLLVALACGCAVLPFAACATFVPSPDNALPAAYYGYCNTQLKGYKSKRDLNLQQIFIPTHHKEYHLDIPDKCAEKKMTLVGGVVTACDADMPPEIRLPPFVVGDGLVKRLGDLRNRAHCYIKLFCI